MSGEPRDAIQQREPKREPRPQDEAGTYYCYSEDCEQEADVAQPRRIASTGLDPIETVVTFCLRCHCAWKTLRETRAPLSESIEIEKELSGDYGDMGWNTARLYPRLLANIVLFDDPRGSDPTGDDSPLGSIFKHAGERGEDLCEKLETPIDEQLRAFDYLDMEDKSEGTDPAQETTFEDFNDD
ncbi:hypothetical protein AV929_16295 [Haloarcula sp. K1]|nr:hypothetical protein AV929_16295 [Haloarcula sp. K1]